MDNILSFGAVFALLPISGIQTSCQFPNFLQYTDTSQQIKPWKTEIWWINLKHNIKWLRKQDIFIEGNNLWRHRENSMKRCDRINRSLNSKSSFGPCSERELVHNRTCLSNEGYNTFKVIQYNPDRSHKFTCMKFIRRSENCVQVAEGPLSDTNDPDLCDESGLVLDEWPWIAPWRKKSYICPISGGFSFRTISRLTNEDHCENEWRRSSLEVECIVGDGLKFMSPVDSDCNPLLRRGHLKKLTCWSGWTTHRYIFMIAGDEAASNPRYCLRFPKDMTDDFSVLIYFSAICPEEEDGKPPTGIQYYELRMKRKDDDRCEDDDEEQCKIIAAQGSCTKDRHKHYADHCRRTCNLCLNRNIARQGCYFDTKLHGSWKLYETDRQEDIKIEKKHVTFSKFGKFFCRESGSNSNQYKTVTTFSNGCVPRYTCFEFSRNNNNLLRYRISRSLRQDKEMEELCSFHEDTYPLLDTYRSFYFKNLILSEIKDLWPSYCGIDSTLPFNGTYSGELCDGTISDWDEDTCTTKGTVTLKSKRCPSLLVPLELQCLAYVTDEMLDYHQMLLTRSMDGKNKFNCWVISSYIIGGKWPWRVMYKMPTTQCTPLSDAEVEIYDIHEAKLYLDDNEKSKECKPVTHISTEVYPRRKTELSSIGKNKESNARDNFSKSNKYTENKGQHGDFLFNKSRRHVCFTEVIFAMYFIYVLVCE